MSELKATTAQEIVRNEKDCDYMDELFGGVKMPPTQVYLKSDVDAAIAELKQKLDDAYKLAVSLRNQKYKRCLAMARYCEERYLYLTCLENYQMTEKEYQQVIGDYWDRWHKRWLELAKKFKDKEAK